MSLATASSQHHAQNTICKICLTRPILVPSCFTRCAVAIDCEMVGAGIHGSKNILARVSITGCDGAILYDKYVQPTEPITDLRTKYSGIASVAQVSAAGGAITLFQLTKELTEKRWLQQSLVVGHALENDFAVLPQSVLPADRYVRDTARCPLLCPDPRQPRSLAVLAAERLGITIQQDEARGHDSTEDARAVMQLFLHVREEWETIISQQLQIAAEEKEEEEEPSAAFKPHATLVDTVLNYHLSDFFDLPRVDDMSPIEMRFRDAKDYAATFRPMIIEENRVGCRRALEIHATEDAAPSIDVRMYMHGYQDREEVMKINMVMKIEEDFRLVPTALMPWTLAILVDKHDVNALQNALTHCVKLGRERSPKGVNFPNHVCVLVMKDVRRKGETRRKVPLEYVIQAPKSDFFTDRGPDTTYRAIIVTSILSQQRADDALQLLVADCNTPNCAKFILQGGRDAVSPILEPYPHVAELERFSRTMPLNESQQKAVLAAVNLSDEQPVLLIQGPPGTGKTSMAIALLSVLTSSPLAGDPSTPRRILTCAPTNVAVREVAKKMTKKFFTLPDAAEEDSPPSRQFASWLGEDPLHLSHLLLIGVERDIEPFGLENEKMVLKKANALEDLEVQEDNAHEQDDDGFNLKELMMVDEIEGAAPAVHDPTLSTIFSDHRIRRLRVLFILLRLSFLELQKQGAHELTYVPIWRKMLAADYFVTRLACIDRIVQLLTEWCQMIDTCIVLVDRSFDLPSFGPVFVQTYNCFPLTPATGSKALRVVLMKAASDLKAVLAKVDEFRIKNAQWANEQAEKLLSDKRTIAEVEQDFMCGNVDLLSTLRSASRISIDKCVRMVDAWQTCISSHPWINDVVTINARLLFTTVSCAARVGLSSAEQRLLDLRSQRYSRRSRYGGMKEEVDPACYSLMPIDSVVIDEAAQLCEAHFAVTFRSTISRFILIGDQQQLPAVVISDQLRMRGYHRSFFERLVKNEWPVSLLTVQYRMHPNISAFPNASFYDGKIEDGRSVLDRLTPLWSSCVSAAEGIIPQSPHELFDRAFSFVNVHTRKGEEKDSLNSLYNTIEIEVVMKELHALHQRIRSALNGATSHPMFQLPFTVGIIAPYRRQVLKLQQSIMREFPNNHTDSWIRISCGTVDSWQGQEFDVLFYSAVRSNRENNIGFVASPQRFNVAITRAKQMLIVIGDHSTLSRSNTLWKAFEAHANKLHRVEARELHENRKLLDARNRDAEDLENLLMNRHAPLVGHAPHPINDPSLRGYLPIQYSGPAPVPVVADPAVGESASSPPIPRMPAHVAPIPSPAQSIGPVSASAPPASAPAAAVPEPLLVAPPRALVAAPKLEHILEGYPFQVQMGDTVRQRIQTLNAGQRRQVIESILQLARGELDVFGLFKMHEKAANEGMNGLSIAEYMRIRGLIHMRKVGRYVLVWTVHIHRESQGSSQRLRLYGLAHSLKEARVFETSLARDLLTRSDAILARTRLWLPGQRIKSNEGEGDAVARTWLRAEDEATCWTRKAELAVAGTAAGDASASSPADSFMDVAPEEGTSLSLMKFFDLSTQFTSLLLDPEARDYEAPFVLGFEEEIVASQKGALIVLGRSGTGKTSIQLLRLFRNEMQSRKLVEEAQRLEAITVSNDDHKEESKESEPSSSSSSASSSAASKSSFSHDILQHHADGGRVHQLMFTTSEQLCRSFKQQYARMMRASVQDADEPGGGGDEFMAQDESDTLPDDFRKLKPSHFPLFLSARKLLAMLDGACDQPFFRRRTSDRFEDLSGEELQRPSLHAASAPTGSGKHDPADLIDYSAFVATIFDKSDLKLRANLSAAMVWTQIQAVIRGRYDKPPLSRQEYMEISARQNTLSQATRERVYSLFEVYTKMKNQRAGAFDLMDAISHVHQQLSKLNRTNLGIPVHFTFVDEVQDILPAQLALLKYIGTPANGIVLAGDSAQAISAGVNFKFSELRKLFFEELITRGAFEVPPTRHLLKNYRSHSGVLNLANTVVGILCTLFPNNIDKLPAEQSLVRGAKPVLILRNVAGHHAEDDRSFAELGADQVILVRDEKAKNELKARLSANGGQILSTIFTIAESKGLEFKDVLIYSFFSDAPSVVQKAFRTIYYYMKQRNLKLTKDQTPPQFDEEEHESLNVDLKLLYVAITRARFNVFLYECGVDAIKPMLALWKFGVHDEAVGDGADPISPPDVSQSLVKVVDTDAEIEGLSIAKKSSAAEYAKKAEEFFQHGKFTDSARLFEHAMMPDKAAYARAHALIQDAHASAVHLKAELQERAKKAGRVDAHALPRAIHARSTPTIRQLFTLYTQAATACLSLMPPLTEKAAHLFADSGQFEQAAQQYCALGHVQKAVDLLLLVIPPAIEQAFKYAEDGRLFVTCLTLSLLYKRVISEKDSTRCISWLQQVQDSQLRSNFVLQTLPQLLKARTSARKDKKESSRLSNVIGAFMKYVSQDQIHHQMTKLERGGDAAVAAEIAEHVIPMQAITKYADAGYLFRAADIARTLISEEKEAQDATPAAIHAVTVSASASVQSKLVELQLRILRSSLQLRLLYDKFDKPFGWNTTYVEVLEEAISQAEGAAPSQPQLLEIHTMKSLLKVVKEQRKAGPVTDKRNAAVLSPLQESLTALQQPLSVTSFANTALLHRLRTTLLIEMAYHFIGLGEIPTADIPAFRQGLHDLNDQLTVLFTGIATARRGEVSSAFLALQDLFGVMPGRMPDSCLIPAHALDHPHLASPSSVITRVVELFNKDTWLLQNSRRILVDAQRWSAMSNITLQQFAHWMEVGLSKVQCTVLEKSEAAILKLAQEHYPCAHTSAKNETCEAGSDHWSHSLFKSATVADIDAIAENLYWHFESVRRRVVLLSHDSGLGAKDVQKVANEGRNSLFTICNILLRSSSLMWPAKVIMKVRQADWRHHRVLEERCAQIVHGGIATQAAEVSASSSSSSTAAPSATSKTYISLSETVEFCTASLYSTGTTLFPLDRVLPAQPTPEFEIEIAKADKAMRKAAEEVSNFRKEHKDYAKDKNKKKRYEQRQSDERSAIAARETLQSREFTGSVAGSAIRAIFQSLSFQRRFYQAKSLDYNLLGWSEEEQTDELFKSVVSGAEAVVLYHHDLIAANRSAGLCNRNAGFESNHGHAVCLTLPAFLALAQRFIVSLACYLRYFEYMVFPESIIVSMMGDAASTRFTCFLAASAQWYHNQGIIKAARRVMTNLRDCLTDLLVNASRWTAFCSDLVSRDRTIRTTPRSDSSSSSSDSDDAAIKLAPHTQQALLQQAVTLVIVIGQNHTRASGVFCYRAIHEQPPELQRFAPSAFKPLYQMKTPQKAEAVEREYQKPFMLGWGPQKINTKVRELKSFENMARATIRDAFQQFGDPLIVLKLGISPPYLNLFKHLPVSLPHFSIADLTGVAHPMLPIPENAKPSESSSSVKSDREDDGGGNEDVSVGKSLLGLSPEEMAARVKAEDALNTHRMRLEAVEGQFAVLGLLLRPHWRRRIREVHRRSIAVLSKTLTPLERIQLSNDNWLRKNGGSWNAEYTSQFQQRVPNLVVKVEACYGSASDFLSKQQQRKKLDEAQQGAELTSGSSDMRDDESNAAAMSSDGLSFMIRSLSAAATDDPYGINRCHELLQLLEHAQLLLSPSHPSHEPAQQDLKRFDSIVAEISVTIKAVDRMMAGLRDEPSKGKPSEHDAVVSAPGESAGPSQPESKEDLEDAATSSSTAAPIASTESSFSSPAAIPSLPSSLSAPDRTLSGQEATLDQKIASISAMAVAQLQQDDVDEPGAVAELASLEHAEAASSSQRTCSSCKGIIETDADPTYMRCDACREKTRAEKKQRLKAQKEAAKAESKPVAATEPQQAAAVQPDGAALLATKQQAWKTIVRTRLSSTAWKVKEFDTVLELKHAQTISDAEARRRITVVLKEDRDRDLLDGLQLLVPDTVAGASASPAISASTAASSPAPSKAVEPAASPAAVAPGTLPPLTLMFAFVGSANNTQKTTAADKLIRAANEISSAEARLTYLQNRMKDKKPLFMPLRMTCAVHHALAGNYAAAMEDISACSKRLDWDYEMRCYAAHFGYLAARILMMRGHFKMALNELKGPLFYGSSLDIIPASSKEEWKLAQSICEREVKGIDDALTTLIKNPSFARKLTAGCIDPQKWATGVTSRSGLACVTCWDQSIEFKSAHDLQSLSSPHCAACRLLVQCNKEDVLSVKDEIAAAASLPNTVANTSPWTHPRLGFVMLKQGRYEEAVTACSQGLVDALDNLPLQLNLAYALLKSRRPNEAIHVAQTCIQHAKPGQVYHVQSMLIFALALKALGDSARSLDLLNGIKKMPLVNELRALYPIVTQLIVVCEMHRRQVAEQEAEEQRQANLRAVEAIRQAEVAKAAAARRQAHLEAESRRLKEREEAQRQQQAAAAAQARIRAAAEAQAREIAEQQQRVWALQQREKAQQSAAAAPRPASVHFPTTPLPQQPASVPTRPPLPRTGVDKSVQKAFMQQPSTNVQSEQHVTPAPAVKAGTTQRATAAAAASPAPATVTNRQRAATEANHPHQLVEAATRAPPEPSSVAPAGDWCAVMPSRLRKKTPAAAAVTTLQPPSSARAAAAATPAVDPTSGGFGLHGEFVRSTGPRADFGEIRFHNLLVPFKFEGGAASPQSDFSAGCAVSFNYWPERGIYAMSVKVIQPTRGTRANNPPKPQQRQQQK